MRGFSIGEVSFLFRIDAIPNHLRTGWQASTGYDPARYVDGLVALHEALTTAGCLIIGLAFLLVWIDGDVGSSIISVMFATACAIGIHAVNRRFACTTGEFGHDLARLSRTLYGTLGKSVKSRAEVKGDAENQLIEIAAGLEDAESAYRGIPNGENKTRVEKSRVEFSEFFELCAHFGLVERAAGWKPFFEPATQLRANESTSASI